MEMYFIKIENLTDYECSDFVAHFNNYEVAQEYLEECIEEYRNDEYDDYLISFGKSHWDNGILIDDWPEAEMIDITH